LTPDSKSPGHFGDPNQGNQDMNNLARLQHDYSRRIDQLQTADDFDKNSNLPGIDLPKMEQLQ